MAHYPWLRTRDSVWLLVVALVLAAWGWDRGRLAADLKVLSQPSLPSQFIDASIELQWAAQRLPIEHTSWEERAASVPPLFSLPTLEELRAQESIAP